MLYPPDWSIKDQIEFTQRKIILNSIMYYDYNTNYISDHYYDELCEELCLLQSAYINAGCDILSTKFGYVFYDFDGSTGYHLTSRLTEHDNKCIRRSIEIFIGS